MTNAGVMFVPEVLSHMQLGDLSKIVIINVPVDLIVAKTSLVEFIHQEINMYNNYARISENNQ